jgi:16S rRNA (guanine966-N2)-methyltransferase
VLYILLKAVGPAFLIMRIIAGEFRGRNILPPASDVTRPITDRVKQSVFDILTPLLGDAVIFDLFAGTGSMGLECLSRGAKTVHFFEADRSALERLRKNVITLNLAGQSTIVAGDLFKWFEKSASKVPADLVFLDPPYRFLGEQPEQLRKLVENWQGGFLVDGATIIFRHDANDRLELPGLMKIDERIYGGMAVEFLRASTKS